MRKEKEKWEQKGGMRKGEKNFKKGRARRKDE
jgi:hypothetical protein